jgi:mannitol/fructose-specific phosphotransferase system IIA component (Ntr-type)
MSEQTNAGHTALQLHTMLTEQTVRAMVRVASWEEAVERAGQLLVEAGAVEPRYVEAMKRVLCEMGPYAVIAPGVVLLHARPEDGVRQPCFGMMTLATPVAFGHKENDPVDVVIAFGAVDKQAHVIALQQLAQLLMDCATLERIRAVPDDHALLSAIRSWDGGRTKEA